MFQTVLTLEEFRRVLSEILRDEMVQSQKRVGPSIRPYGERRGNEISGFGDEKKEK